jgi:rhodanese-related sulfurtransferase
MHHELPTTIGPDEARELLRAGTVRLLDVRTPAEYETAHIPGAYNVPLDTLGEHAHEIRTRVNEPVVLVCQSGNRARRAEEALRAAGLPQLHVLGGGMQAWTASGLPLRRGVPRLSLERQVRILVGALAATGGFLAVFAAPVFALLPAVMGLGLLFSGVTDSCAMGLLLSRLPYNRAVGCDVESVVRALGSGAEPPSPTRAGR